MEREGRTPDDHPAGRRLGQPAGQPKQADGAQDVVLSPEDATFTYEQWILFVAVSFRARYLAVARAAFPELEARLPLARGSRLTVVQVNAGEAVHFIYTDAGAAQATASRALVVETPGGIPLRDWAFLDEHGYKRFVERGVGRPAPLCHFVVFPHEGDDHGTAVEAADRAAREHAAGLRN